MRCVTGSPLPYLQTKGAREMGSLLFANCLQLACDLLEATGTKGGWCEFGVCIYFELRSEGVESCSTALPVARSCSLCIARYTVAD